MYHRGHLLHLLLRQLVMTVADVTHDIADDGHRSRQLVGSATHENTFGILGFQGALVGGLQFFTACFKVLALEGNLVEMGGQRLLHGAEHPLHLAYLVLTAGIGDGRVEVTFGQMLGRDIEPPQWRQLPPEVEEAEHQQHQQANDGDDDHQAEQLMIGTEDLALRANDVKTPPGSLERAVEHIAVDARQSEGYAAALTIHHSLCQPTGLGRGVFLEQFLDISSP